MSNPLTVNAPDGLPFVDFTREFDHPVDKVFAAYTDGTRAAQWLRPRGYEMRVDHYDFRTGGSYAYTHIDPDGNEYAFRGSLHSVRESEIAIQTFEFLGYPDVVSIETLTFEDLGDGRCRLSGHAVYPSLEARDGMVSSGMEQGMADGFDQLEDLLAE